MKRIIGTISLAFLLTISVHATTKSDSITVISEPPSPPTTQEVVVLAVPKNVLPQHVQYFVMVAEAFDNDKTILAVVNAESSFNPKNKNPGSSAKGLFQFLDSTWKHYGCTGSVMDAADNIACAKIAISRNGLSDWTASKSSWAPKQQQSPQLAAK